MNFLEKKIISITAFVFFLQIAFYVICYDNESEIDFIMSSNPISSETIQQKSKHESNKSKNLFIHIIKFYQKLE